MESRKPCSLILYTTLYREGGAKFKRVAECKAEKHRALGREVICRAVESKAEFLAAFRDVEKQGQFVEEMHFFGHSGMYGIMFGTRAWPEQFSPYEWRQMRLPVTSDSRLYFHSCRSGRWFAPFVARTLGVTAFGYQNYTTVSLSPTRFVWERFNPRADKLYIVACAGRKSHGVFASLFKYLGVLKTETMQSYLPQQLGVDSSYDTVAELYGDTFEDIVVRSDELDWLEGKIAIAKPKAMLDIGCGNGAFLNRLSRHFEIGVGVDQSEGMLRQARLSHQANSKLSFVKIEGPTLPFPDNSFDVVSSTLSFRYLDWDPIVGEILRVLKPGGRFLVLDMVTAPVAWHEVPALVISKLRLQIQRMTYRRYYRALTKMVTSRAWQRMLHHNPIRSEHEMRWYLESRFQGQKAEIINVGFRSRILAFDSGEVHFKSVQKLSYP